MARARTRTTVGGLTPELATLVSEVPPGDGWVFEVKYDGYRALATVRRSAVTIATRSGQDWTDHFPGVAGALAKLGLEDAVFDGEIAYVMPDGRTDFQSLQNKLRAKAQGELVYFVFDVLRLGGRDLTGEPLLVRKAALEKALAKAKSGVVRYGGHVAGGGEAFFREACKLGLEGIIAKRADAPYRPGRGKDWLKVKCEQRQELVIVGFTPPKGTRTGLGALLLAVKDGGGFRYAGKVGTGFSHASLNDLVKRLRPLKVAEPSASGAPRMRDATWVRPELVCEVRFTEWTQDGYLRHPTFQGLREDKKPDVVRREVPQAPPEPARRAARAATTKTKTKAKASAGKVDVAGVLVSHPERLVDADAGITKLDVVRYYDAAAPFLAPHAAKRPLMLVRCTDGIAQGVVPRRGKAPKSACFVQKHAGRGLTELATDQAGDEEVIYLTKPPEVVLLAQYNTVEIHGWGSRLPKWDKPDWIVMDFDPDEGLPFTRVVEGARLLREELARLGLASFVKTTGGKGLHVVVPLQPRHDWELVGRFAEALADRLVRLEPSRYVATMSKAKRKGKVFVDWLRNARGATAVLPYSVRARPGLPVAMPIAWKDVDDVDPAAFTVRTAAAYLAKRRKDPWADLPECKQALTAAVVEKLL